MADLAGGKPEKIRGPEVGVDPQDKQTKIAGIVGQHFFDGPDVPDLADRLDLDSGIFLRVIGVFDHCIAPIAAIVTHHSKLNGPVFSDPFS